MRAQLRPIRMAPQSSSDAVQSALDNKNKTRTIIQRVGIGESVWGTYRPGRGALKGMATTRRNQLFFIRQEEPIASARRQVRAIVRANQRRASLAVAAELSKTAWAFGIEART